MIRRYESHLRFVSSTNVQKRIKTNKLNNEIAIIFHFVSSARCFFRFGMTREISRRKTITINYTLGRTFAASSDVTLFPFFYYLTIEFDRKLARCGVEKGYHPVDSIDKWQMGLLGAIKKPTTNDFFFVCRRFESAKKVLAKHYDIR